MEISYAQGSATVTGQFQKSMAGKYVWLDGAWRKLTTWISDTQMGIDAIMMKTNTETTTPVVMNDIEITGGTLTMLEIDYEPKVR